MPFSTALVVSSLFATAPCAPGGDCDGYYGWVNNAPATIAIGSNVEICLQGPADQLGLFMVSTGEGPVFSRKYGTICLDFPLLTSFLFTFDSDGSFCFDVDVDFDPDLVGMVVYSQFLTCHPNVGISDQDLTVVTYGEVCESDDSISSNFNGTDIEPGETLWFNAVVDVKNLATAPAVMQFRGGHVTFSADGTDYDVTLPDSVILVSDTVTEATTVFDAATHAWHTEVPSSYTGNIFLTGVGLSLPAGLPGGINPVLWSGSFTSDTGGVSFHWKWAAAVYTVFSGDPNELGVKPIDGSADNPYDNSDHAGTPEVFKTFVTGGARGGGGSNFTGSYSGSSTAACD